MRLNRDENRISRIFYKASTIPACGILWEKRVLLRHYRLEKRDEKRV